MNTIELADYNFAIFSLSGEACGPRTELWSAYLENQQVQFVINYGIWIECSFKDWREEVYVVLLQQSGIGSLQSSEWEIYQSILHNFKENFKFTPSNVKNVSYLIEIINQTGTLIARTPIIIGYTERWFREKLKKDNNGLTVLKNLVIGKFTTEWIWAISTVEHLTKRNRELETQIVAVKEENEKLKYLNKNWEDFLNSIALSEIESFDSSDIPLDANSSSTPDFFSSESEDVFLDNDALMDIEFTSMELKPESLTFDLSDSVKQKEKKETSGSDKYEEEEESKKFDKKSSKQKKSFKIFSSAPVQSNFTDLKPPSALKAPPSPSPSSSSSLSPAPRGANIFSQSPPPSSPPSPLFGNTSLAPFNENLLKKSKSSQIPTNAPQSFKRSRDTTSEKKKVVKEKEKEMATRNSQQKSNAKPSSKIQNLYLPEQILQFHLTYQENNNWITCDPKAEPIIPDNSVIGIRIANLSDKTLYLCLHLHEMDNSIHTINPKPEEGNLMQLLPKSSTNLNQHIFQTALGSFTLSSNYNSQQGSYILKLVYTSNSSRWNLDNNTTNSSNDNNKNLHPSLFINGVVERPFILKRNNNINLTNNKKVSEITVFNNGPDFLPIGATYPQKLLDLIKKSCQN